MTSLQVIYVTKKSGFVSLYIIATTTEECSDWVATLRQGTVLYCVDPGGAGGGGTLGMVGPWGVHWCTTSHAIECVLTLCKLTHAQRLMMASSDDGF